LKTELIEVEQQKQESMTRYMEIAQTIWAQLCTRQQVMWAWGINQKLGQKEIAVLCSPNGEIFKHNALGTLRLTVNRTALGRKGWVFIALNGMDTYDIFIFRHKRFKTDFGVNMEYAELTHKFEGIYCDQMHEVIDDALSGRVEKYNFEVQPSQN
jgi:hypothetical protein